MTESPVNVFFFLFRQLHVCLIGTYKQYTCRPICTEQHGGTAQSTMMLGSLQFSSCSDWLTVVLPSGNFSTRPDAAAAAAQCRICTADCHRFIRLKSDRDIRQCLKGLDFVYPVHNVNKKRETGSRHMVRSGTFTFYSKSILQI